MTTKPTIPAAIIEKAARAGFAAGAARAAEKYGLETPVTWDGHLTSDDQDHERARTRAALASVYADIQAEARAATLDQLLRAAYVVDTRHHLHETTCSCGFEGNARKRTQTEHITTAVVTEYRAALIARADELGGGTK